MTQVTNEITQLKHVLTKNRSEHIGKDVWKDFVIPRFFNKVDLVSAMPIRLEGGRGSGKTMLLRYLSYYSQFSNDRDQIPKSTVERVGLYWKADTQFLRMMQKRGLDEFKDWDPLFNHYLTLILSFELLNSIVVIVNSKYEWMHSDEIAKMSFEGIMDYGFASEGYFDVVKEIKSRIRVTEIAIQNAKNVSGVEILPHTFLSYLIDIIRESFPIFKDSCFLVYIDEYENLLSYQQRRINTKIKHSEPPLVFNIAIKVNGMSETGTMGEEKIENKADFTIVNLDQEIERNDFEVFVGEILLKKLSDYSHMLQSKNVDVSVCSNLEKLTERFGQDYTNSCKKILFQIFPGRSHEELAEEIFNNNRYIKKLKEEIKRALESKKNSNFEVEDYISEEHKKASIVCASLLFRKKISEKEIYDEFHKLRKGEDNKFTNSTGWEHNNFIGSYLRIARAFKANSSFYSGFDVLTSLAAGNVRHFLELCRSAINLIDESSFEGELSIARNLQHLAAVDTSDELVREVQRFTPLGTQLSNFVLGLGKLFQLYQDRETQSEPEVTHFSIRTGAEPLSENDQRILKEAEKWGVLKVKQSTKDKSPLSYSSYEYILNPIYSPFFFISYRKGRKIELNPQELNTLYLRGESGVDSSFKRNRRLTDVRELVDYQHQESLL